MKEKKSFWKVNPFSLFLVCVLVILAGVNFQHTFQAQVDLVDEINTIEWESGCLKNENAALKAENKSLAEEAALWVSRCLKRNRFMNDMQCENDALVKMSNVVNCCYVPCKEAQEIALWVVKMRYRFLYFQSEIREFLKVKDDKQ